MADVNLRPDDALPDPEPQHGLRVHTAGLFRVEQPSNLEYFYYPKKDSRLKRLFRRLFRRKVVMSGYLDIKPGEHVVGVVTESGDLLVKFDPKDATWNDD